MSGYKIQTSQILRGKIQILQTLRGKIQILKFEDVKFNHPKL